MIIKRKIRQHKIKESGFDFRKDHSLYYLDMAFRIDKRKIIKIPDGYVKITGTCGDTVEIFLLVHEGCIQPISFDTDGCININACCNTLAYLAEGKTITAAWKISPNDVVEHLETFPHENVHCAELIMGSFFLALTSYNDLKK